MDGTPRGPEPGNEPLPPGSGEALNPASPATEGGVPPLATVPPTPPLSAAASASGPAAVAGGGGTFPPPPLARPTYTPPPPPPYTPGGPAMPSATPPPPPRRGYGWLWAMAILVAGGAVVILTLGYFVDRLKRAGGGGSIAARSTVRHSDLREVEIESAATRDKVVVVEVGGVISSSPIDYEGNNLVTHIEEQLERAGEDDYVKAVVLKIDSPGGEVLASDEIYQLVADFQEAYEKPVVASMGTVAASGGYYVAAPCRWIVANELTITGSIGVIMQTYNWRGLMDKLGVQPQVFKSGQFKDMLSPDKPVAEVTDEERRMVQDLVNETFDRFKLVVEEGRRTARSQNEGNEGEETDQGRELVTNWRDFADGRLLSGKEAWRLGFVDELGDFSTAVDRAMMLASIEEARIIQYLRPPTFGSLFRLFGKAPDAKVELNLGVKVPEIRSGLYFIAPQLVR